MKLSVFKKTHHKAPYIIACVILFVFATMLCLVLAFADVYRNAGLIGVAVVASLLAVSLIGAVIFVSLGLSHVVINEAGIALFLGKLRLNKIDFVNVKRIEVVRVRADNSLIINVMTTDKPSCSFRSGLIVSNVNRRKITFEYDNAALDIIMQHYNGKVLNAEAK